MTTLHRGSKYTVPDGATGLDRVFGRFRDQCILGYKCDIETCPLPDNAPGVRDLLGYECVMLGDSAIHVSGFDPFGKQTGPGFVRAIGMQQVYWLEERIAASPPSGLGSRKPDAGMIVTWDGNAPGRIHLDDTWQHFVFFGGPQAFLTLRGVHQWWRDHGFGAFSVRDIAEAVDVGRPSYLRTAGEDQHERSFRRLLETSVGVSNNKLQRDRGQVVLRRTGRWRYTFTEANHGTA